MQKLSLFGIEYISEHCFDELARIREERQYRMYIAEGVYAMTNGMSLTERYSALGKNEPAQSSGEVVENLINKFIADGGVVK